MNPYLEGYWLGVHTRLVTYLADAIDPQLPKGLQTNLEERVFVESVELRDRWFLPDVHVYRSLQRPVDRGSAVVSPGGVAMREPKVIEIPKIEVKEKYLEI